MKKRLQLKKVTLRNLDEDAVDRVAGAATLLADTCGCTAAGTAPQSCCGTCGYPCGTQSCPIATCDFSCRATYCGSNCGPK